ncbi:MAG: hypothetical protein LBH28_06955, partial [Oscillospiraceae bacterium]|nr:hypothetical protein [Oscillospiraceae bacterium]
MKKIVSIAIVAIMILALFMPASAAPPVTVSNFAQFKTALEDATTTHIVFAGDIQIENHGVVINPAKPELVIDGGGYTMTSHYRGSSTPDTLRLTSLKTLKSITLQNMVIVNLNKQGVVHVPDSSSYSDVTVTYNNISMVGAQIIEAKKSIAVFRNCNINLTPFIGNHPSEVAAAAHVRLEGYINIIKDAPGCKMELFHIHAKGGGLSVASGAVVNVEDNVGIGRPKDWGFVKVPYGSCYIRFEDDSKFSYVGNNIFQKGEEISEVYIGRRAEISIRTYGNFFSENGMFSVCGRMTIETGAKVNLLGLGNDKDKPVIWLDKGSELLINNPREVLIYNSYPKSSKDGLAIRADGAKITTFTANNIELLEFWSMNVRAYDSLFGPTREWSNPNGSLFSVSVSQKEKKTTSVFYNGYFGYSPLNAATATLNNVNVIRINGGFAQNEATIIREFYDIDNPYGAPLKVVAPLSVSRGAYNYPHDAIPGYEPA